MGFAHGDDEDDPFYDHEEATAAAPTAALSRPTLARTTSAGRPTATFDEFLSDSSDSDDDEADDGAALERMQGQEDDMEYFGATFLLDSPNGSFAGDDHSFRMDAPSPALATDRVEKDGEAMTTTTTAAWVTRMSRAASHHSDDDNDDDARQAALPSPLTGLSESFDDARPSVDGLDSSFRLFSPNAVAAKRASGESAYSGDLSDSSFVLSSPPDANNSFMEADRPSRLDAGCSNSMDDSFTGVRPSDLDAIYNERLDDSFASERPSHLDRDSLDDSFASDRPSNLDNAYFESLDDSFAGARPSHLDAESSETLDDSFTEARPSSLNVEVTSRAIDAGIETSTTATSSSVGVAESNVSPTSLDESDKGLNASGRADSIPGGERVSEQSDRLSDCCSEGAVPMDDSDSSFRMSSVDGDHWETNDSFSEELPNNAYTVGDADGATGGRSSSSFVAASAFGAASETFEDDRSSLAADADSGIFVNDRTSSSDMAYRISSGSAASFGSNHHSFFVGSVGSEAESLSYPLLTSSPAFSDVVMLGDEHGTGKSHEASSLDRRSFAIHAPSGSDEMEHQCASLRDAPSTLVDSEQPPLLPITVRASGLEMSIPTETSTSSSVAQHGITEDKRMSLPAQLVKLTDNEALSQAFTPPRNSETTGHVELGDSCVRHSTSSGASAPLLIENTHAFRVSSPNAQANAALTSFVSRSSGEEGSNAGDSFSSSNCSEVAARHLDKRSSEVARGSKSVENENDASDFPALTAEALAASGARDNSLDALRQSDEKLDFTGVYRNSTRSRDDARTSRERRSTATKIDSKRSDPSSFMLMTTPVSLIRARSESVQRASERKVEDFFRRTKQLNHDDEDLSAAQENRQTRARTAVEFTLHEDIEEKTQPLVSDRARSKTTVTKKVVDLRSLRSGSSVASFQEVTRSAGFTGRSRALSRPSTRLQIKEDLLEVPGAAPERRSRLTFQSSSDASSSSMNSDEHRALAEKIDDLQATWVRKQSGANELTGENQHVQRNFAHSISSDQKSTQDTSSEDSPNMIPMPPRYMLSPNAHSFTNNNNNINRNGPRFGASMTAGNAMTPTLPRLSMGGSSLTPTLPRLSMGGSSLTPSPFSSSYAAPSSAKAPAFAMSNSGMASGFKWSAQEQLQHLDMRSEESGGLSIKESIWHEAGIPRPTLSEAVATHFHRFSSSLRNTLRRTGVRFFGHPLGRGDANYETTSPKSVCSSPPKLARGFDDSNFYARFGRGGGVGDRDEVIATKQMLARQRNSEHALKKKHTRVLITAACVLMGIVLGLILIHVDSLASAFNLPREEQLQQQRVNGELKVATATQWILLPGKLFLRVWNCVALPLLFCHILNGIADLASTRKAELALSFRSLGYMLFVSVVAALEGVGMMAIIHASSGFKAAAGVSGMSVSETAAALRSRLGAAERVNGTVALKCEFDNSYLQVMNNGTGFRCSNKTIPLPVYDGASENGTMAGINSSAIFVLRDVNSAVKTTSSALGQAYYPHGVSLNQLSQDTVTALVPNNAADALIHSTPVATVAIALMVGLVCGKRVWERGIAAKQAPLATASRIERPGGQQTKPYYILGVFVELQLALEWLADVVESLAPVGVLSLLAGNIVLHREELMTVVTPMVPLVLSVAFMCLLHVAIVSPVIMKLCFNVNAFKSWGLTFLPAYVMCFSTGSVVLSLPAVQQCYERGNEVTKSMAQVSVGMLSVLHRSAHALYFPVAILWLLHTSAPAGVDVELPARLCVLIGVLVVASCFFAPHPVASVVSGMNGGSNLPVIMTLWRAVMAFSGVASISDAIGSSPPPTLPLLVACDVLLSRVVAMTNLHGNMAVARMIAEHCDEVVVERRSSEALPLSPMPEVTRGRLAPPPQNSWL